MKNNSLTYLLKLIEENKNSQIKEFLEKNPKAEKEYLFIKKIYNEEKNRDNIDLKEKYNKILSKIKIQEKIILKKNIINTLKYAAIISMIFFSIFGILSLKKTYTLKNNTTVLKTIILPDSSEVILAPDAYISYQYSLLRKFDRKIIFSGKAYFNIKKNPEKKFLISSSDFCITVLGTKFSVDLTKNEKTVALEEGKILLNNFKNLDTNIYILPGEIAKYYPKTQKVTVVKENPYLYSFGYKDKIYFDNYTIEEIIKLIKLYYDKKIIFDDTNKIHKKIGGSAPSNNLHLIIKALAYITNTETFYENNYIYFKQKNN